VESSLKRVFSSAEEAVVARAVPPPSRAICNVRMRPTSCLSSFFIVTTRRLRVWCAAAVP